MIRYRERGFNMIEVLLTLVIFSVLTVIIFSITRETNLVDIESKRIHFADSLVSPYIAYYQNAEIDREDVSVYLSDMEEIDLVKEFKSHGGLVPRSLVNTRVVCENSPREDSGYLVFEISCKVNGKEINKGRAYTIKKYIN